jgi:hypothetical protein
VNETKAQRPLETWTVPEVQLSIEYAVHVLREINGYAVEGLKQLSRGGVAVGGVLFGSRAEKSVRIVTWRPVACEHVKGAAFILSQNDRNGLAQLLNQAQSDPELDGLHAIGWFVSHTRDGVSLSEPDTEVFSHFFPWSWQIALVVRPFRDRPSLGGFFVRDDEGRVKSDASYREFRIDGASGQAARAVQYPVTAEHEAAVVNPKIGRVPEVVAQLDPVRPAMHRLAPARIFSDRRLWIWAAPAILALIVWAVVVEKPVPPPIGPPSLGFRALDSSGQLRLEWDQYAQPIRTAKRGTLSIRDGRKTPVQLDLDTAQLASGSYLYARTSADLEVVLTVYPVPGAPVEESARFIGPPLGVANTADPVQLLKQREDLSKENELLRQELRREASRNRELEEAIQALKNRMEVERLERAK